MTVVGAVFLPQLGPERLQPVARAADAADAVVLQPTDDDPDPESFMALAAEVGRLVR